MRPSVKVSVRTPPNTKNLFRETQPTKINVGGPFHVPPTQNPVKCPGADGRRSVPLYQHGTASDEAKSKLRRVFGIEPNVLGIEIGGPVHRLPRSEADL